MKGIIMYKKKFLNKIMVLLLLNIIILRFVTNECYANLDDLSFNNMNIEQGISQATIETMFQDSR